MEFLVFLHPILSLIILFFHGHFYLLTHSDLDFSQSAVGHEYVAEVEKHSSQTDAARGFGGKYGVEKDRADKVSDNSLPVPPNSDHVGLTNNHLECRSVLLLWKDGAVASGRVHHEDGSHTSLSKFFGAAVGGHMLTWKVLI